MSTKRFQLLVFDWDGTLMDSKARIVASFQSAIEEVELPPRSAEHIQHIIGLGLDKAIATLYPQVEPKLQLELAHRYRYHFLNVNTLATPLFPGVVDTLNKLYAQDYDLAVATGKSRAGLDRALTETGLLTLFRSTRCAEETCSKPDPLMLQEIMEEMNVSAEKTLMIGDSEYDLHMARHAGVAAIGVSYGVHDKARLLNCSPLTCLDHITEIEHWLGAKIDSAPASG
ncbi:MAG: HAD-IIIA family hydrolase [Pseudomonadota bacterium]|nr:HAD-IIIA family hydrolase [Pseudomonadota bacterium]